MRITDHARWDRGFPVKYLLVQEDEDGVERLWGRCAGVEGLFVEPVPPTREILTLRGCSPDGLLSEVLAEPGASYRGLGDVCVEVWNDDRPVQWWTLADAVVVAHQPHPGDPARHDLVVGAGVTNDEGFFEVPEATRFELFAGTTTVAASAGRCSAVDGLFEPRADAAPVPMELIGCEPAEPLLAALRRPQRAERDWADLLVLDRHGAVMASRTVGLDITGASPSVLGGTLVDITLADGGDDRPSPTARAIWAEWYEGPPTEPNRWAPYDSKGRAAWLDLATRAWRVPTPRPDRTGGAYDLDGRFVTDVPGLHCAIAEALLGPGRYFGREWNALKDCLGGGFGVAPPFTLTWHDSEVARRALADAEDPEGRPSYLEEIVRLLERHGVTVVLR
ncbi:barstar family protein [Streptomyces bambusae]|uniref:barstar family protein n=1 Tax=Streptomyces bambusae TaxID=1550616 RepID=UPI001CFDD6F8|nr:barstar family protein [Streptomyces bambusae]MCB5168880.1 barstar family protein [Streptomyces bambusae]